MTPRPGMGMRGRLLLAQTLVLLAGGATTWVVASVVGPPLFREHLHQAGVEHNSNEQFHAEQAYQHATALSIAVAITVAASTAFVVTAYLSRRLQHSIAELSQAAAAIAEGHYDIRVAPPQLGGEFENLAGSFNQMAQRLQSVESTRRRMFGDLAHEIRTPVAVLEAGASRFRARSIMAGSRSSASIRSAPKRCNTSCEPYPDPQPISRAVPPGGSRPPSRSSIGTS